MDVDVDNPGKGLNLSAHSLSSAKPLQVWFITTYIGIVFIVALFNFVWLTLSGFNIIITNRNDG